jgi:hypothetical protein
MLKKIGLIAGFIVVMSLFFGVAVAASDEVAPQVAVYYDNVLMEFEVEPFIENGSTQVPFRPIFEKLGLRIGWNDETKTVIGEKEGLSIQLQIGNKTAVVNGVEKQLNVAPLIKNGFTFIPVRFVIEHSDKDVTWHGHERIVYIADIADQVRFVYEKYHAYINQEDIEGVMSTVDPTSREYESIAESWSEAFDIFDLAVIYSELMFTQLSESRAIIQTSQVMTSRAGTGYKDNSTIKDQLFIKTNGEWKQYMTQLLFIDYLKNDLHVEGEVTTSLTDQQAIRQAFEATQFNAEDEDKDDERILRITDFEDLERQLKGESQADDVVHDEFIYSDIKFISGTDKEAKIHFRRLTKWGDGTYDRDHIIHFESVYKKDVDDMWKFVSSEIRSVDYRIESIEAFLVDE